MSGSKINIDISRFEAKRQPVIELVQKEKVQVMQMLAKVGEEEIRNVVRTRGTDFSQVRQQYGIGSSGRVRSGRMLNAVGSKETGTRKMYTMAVGFVRGFKADYYYYQEYGFRNVWKFVKFGEGKSGPNAPDGFIFRRIAGGYTEGMHSLRDAKQSIKDKIGTASAEMRKMIRFKSRTL
jgi:hypothetical protein